jgi:hypothetical protein
MLTVRLEPRQRSLMGNHVAALLSDDIYVWAGVVPEGVPSNTTDLLWSRYHRKEKRWELDRRAPEEWNPSKESVRADPEPRALEPDGTVWEITEEEVEDPPVRVQAAVLVQRDSVGGEVIRRISLYPNAPFYTGRSARMAVTGNAVWLGVGGLLRVDKEDGAITKMGQEQGISGFVTVLLSDPPYLWIGTQREGLYRLHAEAEGVEHFFY